MGLTGNTVLMPDTAPLERSQGLEKMGVKVERMKSAELLQGVERLQQEHGAVFLHPFDDRHLIAGYGSLGLEILQDVPDADFVLVCCGGGGLLAGTATALAYFATGKRIRVFGVEPETASGMRMSLQVITRLLILCVLLQANFHCYYRLERLRNAQTPRVWPRDWPHRLLERMLTNMSALLLKISFLSLMKNFCTLF